jgi:hypothetical protein
MSVEEVADMGGWRVSDIKSLKHSMEWQEAIRSIGGPQVSGKMANVISEYTTKQELRHAPKPIAEFIEMVQKAKLSAEDCTPFVEQFLAPVAKNKKKHAVYTERLEEVKDDPEIQTRLKGRKSTKIRRDVSIRKSLLAAKGTLDKAIEAKEKIHNVDEFYGLLNQIRDRLKKVAGDRKGK